MKQILLLSFFTFICFSLEAQICEPNQIYADSAVGVYPPPFSDDRPDGGIPNEACINEPFEFVLTFKVPETISIFTLDSIVVASTGAVTGLPDGLSYSCNPPNCVFTPQETLGCVLVFGTPTNPNDIGDNPLMVATKIFANGGLIEFDVTFPDNTGTVPNADGQYILTVNEEGAAACQTTSTNDLLQSNLRVINSPNPFSYFTNILVDSGISGDFDLTVYDLTGRQVQQQAIRLTIGENQIPFDGSDLSNGMYLYSIAQGAGKVVNKMIIQR
ncbi:MAG: T9SS type A sorting domain-containing protein [Bacteroidota bacterium]